jgi:hypothetical protein
MALDDLTPDDDGSTADRETTQGQDEIPRRTFNIDFDVTAPTVILEDAEQAKFPTDEMLDTALEPLGSEAPEEHHELYWVDTDELWAWHEGSEVNRRQPEFRSVVIIVKVNSKYAMNSVGEPAEWLRETSSQINLGTVEKWMESANRELNKIGVGIHGFNTNEFERIAFTHLNAVPQDVTPIWQEFLQERDQWLDK